MSGPFYLPNSGYSVLGCHRSRLTNPRILETTDPVDYRLACFTLVWSTNCQHTVFLERHSATIRINDFGSAARGRHHSIAGIQRHTLLRLRHCGGLSDENLSLGLLKRRRRF